MKVLALDVLDSIPRPTVEPGPDIDVTLEKPMTPDEMRKLIAASSADVLHVMGMSDTKCKEAILHFNSKGTPGKGAGMAVTAPELVSWLGGAEHPPRVILLETCESDQVAFTVSRTGIAHAVIGVRGAVTEQAVQVFTRKLYASMLAGATVIAAVSEARRALDLAFPGRREWGLFTLYHRAGDIALETNQSATVTKSWPVSTDLDAAKLEILQRNLETIDQRLQTAVGRSATLLQEQRAELAARIEKSRPQ
jgi:hypothetical protein